MWACLPHPEALSTLTCSLVMASWPLGSSPSSQHSPSVTSITDAVRKMALTWWGRRKLPLLPYAGNCQRLLEAKAGFSSCQETGLFLSLPKRRGKKEEKKKKKKRFWILCFTLSSFIAGWAAPGIMDHGFLWHRGQTAGSEIRGTTMGKGKKKKKRCLYWFSPETQDLPQPSRLLSHYSSILTPGVLQRKRRGGGMLPAAPCPLERIIFLILARPCPDT